MKKKQLIVIVGPTAVGKTDLAIDVARELGTEIISCDSRQMYRELNIGVARPSEEQLSKVKHHFIACLSIGDYYNASKYEMEVLALLNNLFEQHQTIVMTGGSGLYVDAVLRGIDDYPTTDPEVRENLLQQYKTEGVEGLRLQLKQCDPDYYHQVDLRNPMRILKGLEVYAMTGKPYSSFLKQEKKSRPFNLIKIGLNRDRAELHQIINERVDMMMHMGLLDEVKSLLPMKHLNALNTVGYKELFDYLDGLQSLDEAVELIKRNTRRYARRQISYFSRDKEMQWFQPNEKENIQAHIKEKLL
jgi:tRNA dimethylallyltransferase